MIRLISKIMILLLLVSTAVAYPAVSYAQDALPSPTPYPDEQPEAPEQVDVNPQAQDEQIAARLERILEATGWFTEAQVVVQEGVVFIDGRTTTEEYRTWAGNLARNTQDVVAVVNRTEVIPRPAWDFSPAFDEIQRLWLGAIRAIPLLIFGVIVLFLAWWLTKAAARLASYFLRNRLGSPLLTNIVAYITATPVLLLGLYLVLQVAGLTRLALTVLGGTGIAGIVIGFAFRDITENFLASILLSIRNPFHSKDLIEVAGHTGIVQQMNTRSTILMTLDGNHIQIPNATIFKNTIVNYTSNPNRRGEFNVGIGYDDSILQAQEVIMQIMRDHPAVLNDPEPLVLVKELGASTVNLQILFWHDATVYAPHKIKSSVIRLVKRGLTEANISMPDEAREVVFPKGVPIITSDSSAIPATERQSAPKQSPPPAAERTATEPITNAAEGNLYSEDADIQRQAAQARNPEEGENLLERSS